MIKSTLALLMIVAMTPCAAEELGRLFFDPKERQTLEDLRERALKPPGSEPERPRFEGSVRRNDGVNTVWLNGRPMSANDAQSGAAIKLSDAGIHRIVIQQTGNDLARPIAPGTGSSPKSVRDKRKADPVRRSQSAAPASTAGKGLE